jgi:ribulose 1,5-bisphosphate carboxylase large subunit-like protein
MNKSISRKLATVNKVDTLIKSNETINSYQRLLATSAASTLDVMSLSKAVKHYVETSQKYLTEKQLQIANFKAILDFIKSDEKLQSEDFFTFHQIALIANKLIKANDNNVKRAERAAKQQARANKK